MPLVVWPQTARIVDIESRLLYLNKISQSGESGLLNTIDRARPRWAGTTTLGITGNPQHLDEQSLFFGKIFDASQYTDMPFYGINTLTSNINIRSVASGIFTGHRRFTSSEVSGTWVRARDANRVHQLTVFSPNTFSLDPPAVPGYSSGDVLIPVRTIRVRQLRGTAEVSVIRRAVGAPTTAVIGGGLQWSWEEFIEVR